MKRLLATLTPHAGTLVLAVLLVTASAAVPGASVLLLKEALDAVTTEPDLGRLGALTLAFGGLQLAGALAHIGRTALTKGLAWRMTTRLRTDLHRAWLEQPPGPVGERLARLTTEVDELQFGVAAAMGALRNPIAIVVLAATALALAPSLAPWAVLLVVPIAGLTAWGGRLVRSLSVANRDARAAMADLAQQHLLGVRTVQDFDAAAAESHRFAALAETDRSARVRLDVLRMVPPALVQAAAACGVATLLYVGGARVVDGTLAPGSLVAFIVALGLLARPLADLSEVVGMWHRSAAALERVWDALDAAPVAPEPADAVPIPDGPPEVVWDDVTVRFDRDVIRGVTLRGEPGGVLALVGPTGAGKSTLLRLVGRHVRPVAGEVRLGGVPVDRVRGLRRAVAVVAQEPFLFSRTVADNVALGHPDATRAAIEAACREAGVHDAVAALPRGYDTELVELGGRLSGGERQRLTVARALLTGARVLLLDEPTNQLDAATERAVLRSVEACRGRRTVVLVAHHLAAVEGADRIAFVEAGRVVEQGTHAELLALGGRYAALWEEQRDVA